MDKPFIAGARPVRNADLIGRKEVIASLTEKFLSDQAYSVSLCGLPRIGKTSVIMQVAEAVQGQDEAFRVISLNLAAIADEEEACYSFWANILEEVLDMLEEGPVTSRLEKELDRLSAKDDRKIRRLVEKAFKEAYKQGLKLMLVLDYFDLAKQVFAGDPSQFQFIRELKGSYDTFVAMAFVSDQTLGFIEENYAGTSLLSLTVDKLVLRGFNELELEEYYAKLAEHGISLTTEEKDELEKQLGNLPYLLAVFGNEVVAQQQAGSSAPIEAALQAIRPVVEEHYEEIISNLKRYRLDGDLQKLLQGKAAEVNQMAVEKLVDEGYMDYDKNDRMVTLCQGFAAYIVKES